MSDAAALPHSRVPELALPERLSSDERLARLVSRGSERAFTQLYRRHHQALYRYCRSILRNDEDAQDALQSAMTRAFAALRSQERDLAVRPWLFRIAHNEAISLIRRRRQQEGAVEEQADLMDLDAQVAQREQLATLVADLGTLAERQRAALVMRELSGLSIEEIAAALSTSPGAAKQALFEARSALHELAEGRAMECEAVRRLISESDGRVLRGRKVRAHLRACSGCRDFQSAIETRGAQLRALAPPLPVAAAGTILTGLLARAGGGHGGGAAVSGAVLGTHGASLAIKAIAGVAAVGAAAAGTARLTVLAPSHGHAHPAVLSSPTPRTGAPTAAWPGHAAHRTQHSAVALSKHHRARTGTSIGIAAPFTTVSRTTSHTATIPMLPPSSAAPSHASTRAQGLAPPFTGRSPAHQHTAVQHVAPTRPLTAHRRASALHRAARAQPAPRRQSPHVQAVTRTHARHTGSTGAAEGAAGEGAEETVVPAHPDTARSRTNP